MRRATVRSGLLLGWLTLACLTSCVCSQSPPPAQAPGSADPRAPTAATALAAAQPALALPVSESEFPKPRPGSFADDVAFLQQHGDIITLRSPSGGVVAASAQYQGRVMTSAVASDGQSLGYINRDFVAAGRTGTQFDNYGGEDRFWLGPEGGQFALYFPPGKPFEFQHWQTPATFQEGEWQVTERSPSHVVFARAMELTSYAGTVFKLEVKRTLRLLNGAAVATLLGTEEAGLGGLRWVAFETSNQITNAGDFAWTEKTGAPSVWILAMYNPAKDTWVIAPFDPAAKGNIVNDRYFGKVPAERLVVMKEGALLFKCDGQLRSKIGLSPQRARPFVGSYSASSQLLTLVHYDRPKDATRYVNSMWEKQKNPFGGDVVNSYNDGPVEPGKPALGGFYELETSSPAAKLEPGQSLMHTHRTLHFVGDQAYLEPLAQRALGVTLAAAAAATTQGR